MPDLAWNANTWGHSYKWARGGEEWSQQWGSSRAQWFGSIYPRIHAFLPSPRLLEIAPGFGRWTRFLLPSTADYVGVDLSESCVAHCQAEFSRSAHARFYRNDGCSLSMLANGTRDFVFSFDSLVHAELDVMHCYVREILRVLTSSGAAFIHHSNTADVPFDDNPHNRAKSVSARLIRAAIEEAGGKVWLQELINWGTPACIDALTLFSRSECPGPSVPRTIENREFMMEAHLIRTYQDAWSSCPAPVPASAGDGDPRDGDSGHDRPPRSASKAAAGSVTSPHEESQAQPGESLAVHIEDISQSPGGPHIAAFCLEAPTAGFASEMFAFPVSGWVLGARVPARSIDVLCCSHLVRSIPVDVPRPDVVRAYPGAVTEVSGFSDAIGIAALTQAFELELVAVLADGSRQLVATLRGGHDRLIPAERPRMHPIMVTSLGRCGTTWMMRLLGGHPEVVAHDRYPHELAAAGYWAHVTRVLTDPPDAAEVSNPHALAEDVSRAGRNPYYAQVTDQPDLQRVLRRDDVHDLAAVCVRRIDDWYATMARAQGRSVGRYFAEKCTPQHIPIVLWNLYPNAKEVFLVRDFRDMASSILAFNRKRGYAAFGRHPDDDDERHLHRLRESAEGLLASWVQRRDRAHLVHYEDLVRQPAVTLLRLLEYLELDAAPESADRMLRHGSSQTKEVEWHSTSPSLADSVGRWRREPPELRELMQRIFGDLARQFRHDSPNQPEAGSDDSESG